MVINLREETIEKLKENGKTLEDIKWIGRYNRERKIGEKLPDDETSLIYMNQNYDNGYGGEEIDLELVVVGDNWWLERHEYDGSEWWEYKELPKLKGDEQ